MVSDLYKGNTQARFFSLLMQISGLAPIVAPILGSQLLRFTSWHGIFLTLAVVGVVLFLTVALGLGETLPTERRQRDGLAASLRAFRDLLSNRRFVGYALSCGLAFASGIIYISVSPFILQNIYAVSPQNLGVLLGINALGIVVMAQVGGRFVARVGPQTMLAWGVAIMAIGGVALLVVVLADIGLIGILPSLFVIVASLGLIAPNATSLALSDTTAAGSASAVLGLLQFTIGALAAPLVGLGGTSTAIPMAGAIAAFGVATMITFVTLCRPESSIAG